MTSSTSPIPDRPVLIWHPDTDASHVQPTVEQAAAALNVGVEDVMAGIASGELVGGWFVDWDVSGASGQQSVSNGAGEG